MYSIIGYRQTDLPQFFDALDNGTGIVVMYMEIQDTGQEGD
jgi:hypothetical protein